MMLAPDNRPWLAPLACFYGLGRIAHRSMYTTGILKRRQLPRPVICVGNVSVGGTGKTPFIIMLANELIQRGLRPCVLSRGYRAQPPAKQPRLVSDGRGWTASAAESGDEPLLIARSCPGVPVVICSDRHAAGMLGMEKFAPDLFLLDDGFQHEALARDADLVLWDVRDDPVRSLQLPAGRMRESPVALRRASVVILTHAEYVPREIREDKVAKVRSAIERIAPGTTIFEAAATISSIIALKGGAIETQIGSIQGRAVTLLSGIARPEGFEALVREAGGVVAHNFTFADHAHYTREMIDELVRESRGAGAEMILTTEKDAVKLLATGADLAGFHAARLIVTVKEQGRWNAFLDRLTNAKQHHKPTTEDHS